MAKYEIAQDILEKYFPNQYTPQSIKDWQGPFLLHQDLIEYYAILGPLNINLPGYGNNFYLPKLADLWQYQEGYRWNGLTGEKLSDWKDEWLVVADEGADPFIFSRTTGIVLFDYHGSGIWEPKELFGNIETMVTSLLILASIVKSAGRNLTNEQGRIKEDFREIAEEQLNNIMQSAFHTQSVLLQFEWM